MKCQIHVIAVFATTSLRLRQFNAQFRHPVQRQRAGMRMRCPVSRSCQRDSLCILSVAGFETRITLQLSNHVLHPDRTTATLKQQSQSRLRNVTSCNVETMDQLPNTFTFSWRNIVFGFVRRRCNKNCGRGGQQTVSFRQENVKLNRTEVMNKNRSPIFESMELDALSCLHVFVSTCS